MFKDGLKDVQLIWSKTLQVTAGRASFRRHQDGKIETKIELAIKVLDCEGLHAYICFLTRPNEKQNAFAIHSLMKCAILRAG